MSKKKKEFPNEDQLEDIVNSFKKIISNEDQINAGRWFLHTGNLALDYIISGLVSGEGGYPSGVCELFGEQSSGKTILIIKAAAEMQRMGGLVAVADAEGRWEDAFAEKHGVRSSDLGKYYPETVEEWAIKSLELLKEFGYKKKILLILDSLAILSTIKEIEDVEGGDIKADQGRKAQKIKAAMRALRGEINRTGALVLISNHIIDSPGSYGNQKFTPGGRGVPFQANVRIELSKPTPLTIKDKDRPIGVELHIKIAKNSVSVPFGETDIQLYWSTGISKYSGLLDLALDIGIIERRGAWNYWKDVTFQASDFEKTLIENPGILMDDRWNHPYWMEV